jgi:hypothetical protein
MKLLFIITMGHCSSDICLVNRNKIFERLVEFSSHAKTAEENFELFFTEAVVNAGKAHQQELANFLTNQFSLADKAYSDLTAIVMSSPGECFNFEERRRLGKILEIYLEDKKSHIQFLWNGVIFGVLGHDLNGKVTQPLLLDHFFTFRLSETLRNHVEFLANEYKITLSKPDRFLVRNEVTSVVDRHLELGMFDSKEALKRTIFNGWILDKGLCKGLLRHVFEVNDTIGDFGAGGGHYSTWFNETGIVVSYAYDGTPLIEAVTDGKVTFMDLTEHQTMDRSFDWVFSIEVAEHIPKEFELEYLRNLQYHSSKGLIISWANSLVGLGHVNVKSFEEVIEFIESNASMTFDHDLTRLVRGSIHLEYIKKGFGIFRKKLQ